MYLFLVHLPEVKSLYIISLKYEYIQICVYMYIYIISKYNILSLYASTCLHVFRLTIWH